MWGNLTGKMTYFFYRQFLICKDVFVLPGNLQCTKPLRNMKRPHPHLWGIFHEMDHTWWAPSQDCCYLLFSWLSRMFCIASSLGGSVTRDPPHLHQVEMLLSHRSPVRWYLEERFWLKEWLRIGWAMTHGPSSVRMTQMYRVSQKCFCAHYTGIFQNSPNFNL